jgi:hypothetical protein
MKGREKQGDLAVFLGYRGVLNTETSGCTADPKTDSLARIDLPGRMGTSTGPY